MAKFIPVALAFALHIALWMMLVAASNTSPEDTLLTKAEYQRQSAFIAFYEAGAEISVDGTRYELQCTPYRNDLGEWEAVETPTGQFIKIGENGTTTAKIEGRFYTFLPE